MPGYSSVYHGDNAKGLPIVVAHLDDILVAGRTEQEDLVNLAQVLEQPDTADMRPVLISCTVGCTLKTN